MENFRLKFLYDHAKAGEVQIALKKNAELNKKLEDLTAEDKGVKENLRVAEQKIDTLMEDLKRGEHELYILKGQLKATKRVREDARRSKDMLFIGVLVAIALMLGVLMKKL